MQEGESSLGGLHIDHGNTQPANTGNQPVGFETLQNSQTAQATQNIQAASSVQAPKPMQLAQPTQSTQPVRPVQPTRPIQPAPTTQFPAQPSATTDVVLGNKPKKASKTIKIILIGLVLATLLSTTIFLIINFFTRTTSEDSLRAFNRVANYLLIGVDSEMPLTSSYSPSERYAAQKRADFLDGESDIEYFVKLGELNDNLLSIIQRSNIKQELKEKIIIYSQNISPWIKVNLIFLNNKAIINALIESGYEQALHKAQDEFSIFVQSDNQEVSTFGEKMVTAQELRVNYLQLLYDSGCNISEIVECSTIIDQLENDGVSLLESSRLIDEATGIAGNLLMAEVPQSWNLSLELQEETK